MPDIHITVRGKVATGDDSRIVCGNSDYSIIFDFDEEWDAYDVKTARFVYAGMNGKYIDVVFSGATCTVPVLQDAIGVYVGVYAGDLHTTTPAWFECDKSILCGGGSPAAPLDDVYNQIMDRLNKLGTPDAEAIAAAVADYIAENPIEEKDPTVPDWAKEEKKPSYTAAEVCADPSGTAASQVSAHNTETTAHSDIRLLIQGLTDRLNALADSDDTTLDQLSEIVAYIKSNRDMIAAITTDKVSVSDIVDNLTTNVANKPLSAAQGVALKAMIDAINAVSIGAIPAPATATVGQTIRVSAVDENGQPTEWEAVDMESGGNIVYQETILASGTISASDTSPYKDIETGLTIGDLKKWKRFACFFTPGTNCYCRMKFPYRMLSGLPGARPISIFEWADRDQTILECVFQTGADGYFTSIDDPFVIVSTERFGNKLFGYRVSPITLGDDEKVYVNVYSKIDNDVPWKIVGLTKEV